MARRKKNFQCKFQGRPFQEMALFLLDILYNAVVIIALVVLIRTFLISPFRVIGSSMAETLENNEFILIDRLSYRLGEPRRGDPVVFLPPITNKYANKFEEFVTTDAGGKGILNIQELRAKKNIFYCRNSLMQMFWFCKERVQANDLMYFLPVKSGEDGSLNEVEWKWAQKKIIQESETKKGFSEFQGYADQSYSVRIYNSTGPEYFVKRIIGIPGDVVRIENGRVYLKTLTMENFTELKEFYLNPENLYNTYSRNSSGTDEFSVPPGHYFVLGDNRSHSNDSRHWFSPIDETFTPFVSQQSISGKVLIVLWPPHEIGLIPAATLEKL